MSSALSVATPARVIGRLVGRPAEYVAVTVMPASHGRGYLLAVHRNGTEYATFAYEAGDTGNGVNVWAPSVFAIAATPHAAFIRASRDLITRATGHR